MTIATLKVSPWIWMAAAVPFGAFVYACLPDHVVALDDDFAYLRSVVLTLRAHHPVTDEWLEPWGASLSLASAALYWLSGSFYFATYGLLALLGGTTLAFAALNAARRASPVAALVAALLFVTQPTVFWKLSQYTAMALYIPCLLAAIWAWEGRRWTWFALCWCVGIGARQSAAAWGALPLFALVDAWLCGGREHRKNIFPFAAILAGGVGVYLVLARTMNVTHAQRFITQHTLDNFSATDAVKVLLLGILIFTCAAGAGQWLRVGSCYPVQLRARSVGFVLVGAIALFSWWFDVRPYLGWEFDFLAGAFGSFYLKALIALSLAGFAWKCARWNPFALIGATASLATLMLRGQTWDYYFIDVAIFGLFSQRPDPETQAR